MNTHWRTTKWGAFEVSDRQGLVAMIFGGALLFVAGCFLYWLGTAVVEYARFATWMEILKSLPGMLVALLMAGLFGIPGILMALLSKRTTCSKTKGLIRQVTFYGVFRRVREIKLGDVRSVVTGYKLTKRSRHSGGHSAEVHTVEIVSANEQRMEVAQLGNWNSALDLGRQLARYLGVEFMKT